MTVKLCDGKYEFYVDGYTLKCRRHGQDYWRDFTGDKAIHALFDAVVEKEQTIIQLVNIIGIAHEATKEIQEKRYKKGINTMNRYEALIAALKAEHELIRNFQPYTNDEISESIHKADTRRSAHTRADRIIETLIAGKEETQDPKTGLPGGPSL